MPSGSLTSEEIFFVEMAIINAFSEIDYVPLEDELKIYINTLLLDALVEQELREQITFDDVMTLGRNHVRHITETQTTSEPLREFRKRHQLDLFDLTLEAIGETLPDEHAPLTKIVFAHMSRFVIEHRVPMEDDDGCKLARDEVRRYMSELIEAVKPLNV